MTTDETRRENDGLLSKSCHAGIVKSECRWHLQLPASAARPGGMQMRPSDWFLWTAAWPSGSSGPGQMEDTPDPLRTSRTSIITNYLCFLFSLLLYSVYYKLVPSDQELLRPFDFLFYPQDQDFGQDFVRCLWRLNNASETSHVIAATGFVSKIKLVTPKGGEEHGERFSSEI